MTSKAHFRQSPVIDRLKSQKTNYSNPPQDLGLIKIQLWWSRVPLLLWCHGQACCHFPTKFKPQFIAKDIRLDQCIRTAETPCFGWIKWPCTVHSQSTLCFFFIGSIAEPKVNSWSEATLRQLFQDWLLVMWALTFPVLFPTTDFVFCKSGVLLFLHYWDTVSNQNLVSRTLCPIWCLKNVQHWMMT